MDLVGQSYITSMKKKQDLRFINIITTVKSTIIKHDMIRLGDRIVVGVSGGPDSMCLLHVLYNLREHFHFELIAAHFEHGLRPGEDEKETEFVSSFVKGLRIPFEYQRPVQDIKNGQGSLEERARLARYAFLEEVRKRYNAHKIALGHNMNDQAETVIMRLLRGSGISGLKGIPPVRDGVIIRPIIGLRRDDVLYYLQKRGLQYMKDSSNADETFLRNRIRHKLIPILKQYQPNVISILSRTSEIIGMEDDFMEVRAREWVDTNVLFKEGIIGLPIHPFKGLHTALKNRVIRYLLKKRMGHLRRISYEHINAIIDMIHGKRPNMEAHLPYNIVVRKVYNWILFDEKKELEDFYYEIPGHGKYYLDAINSWIIVEQVNSVNETDKEGVIFLDADMIEFPVVIRNMRPGDRIALWGMDGHKKIKDIFIDMKIPLDVRRAIPILENKGLPIYLWYINKMDNRYKVGSKSNNILKIGLRMEKTPLWEHIYKEASHAIG